MMKVMLKRVVRRKEKLPIPRPSALRSSSQRAFQAIFRRRRHQPRRPPPAKIRPGRPAPAMGPGTAAVDRVATIVGP